MLAIETVLGPIGGITAGAGIVYIFMRGALAQMASWKELVLSHQNSNKQLIAENTSLHAILEQHRTTLNKVRLELAISENERHIQTSTIEEQGNKIASLNVQVIDLKTKIISLERTRDGK